MTDQQDDSEQDLAPEDCKCPACGEQRIDWLVWKDDDTIECMTCRARYKPLESPEDRGPFSLN